MPKTPETYPKPRSKNQKGKNKLKEKQAKAQPKTPSLLRNKYYWVFVALVLIVFTTVYGYSIQLSLGKEGLILGAILMVIAFAFYMAFKPYPIDRKRVILILIGISIIGFSIWAVTVLLLDANGLLKQIIPSIGDTFFAITSLIICLVIGAFIGDLIHRNMEKILALARSFRSRVSSSAPRREKK
jgi:polyferredoxin